MKATWAHTHEHQNTGQSGTSTVWGCFCHISAKLCLRAKAKGPREFSSETNCGFTWSCLQCTHICWAYMVSVCLRAKHSEGLNQSNPFSPRKWSDSRGRKEKGRVFWIQTSALFKCPGYWGADVRKWVRKKQYEVSTALWQKLHVYKAVTGLFSTEESSLTPHS